MQVCLSYDEFAESPSEWEGWELYSFCSRHSSFKAIDLSEIQDKLDSGEAFILSYFEHGNCVWSLQGTGPQCPWDSVDVAGVLIWEDDVTNLPDTYEERRKWATSFVETYTAWANGQVFYYDILDEEGDSVDACGQFMGDDLDYMFEEIGHHIRPFDKVEFVGEAAYLADYHEFKKLCKP
jgi:hypothetical protein